VLTEEEK